MVRTLALAYNRRVASFKRRGVVSQAQIQFENAGPVKTIPIKDMSYNQLLYELARFQAFFNSKTSSVAGINRVNREQDRRIFGKSGGTMSDDERKNYWAVYNEFMNQNRSLSTMLSSSQVQQMLGSMQEEDGDLTGQGIQKAVDDLRENLLEYRAEQEEQEYQEGVPNVYSGSGPFRGR